jgi:hypothetical protein
MVVLIKFNARQFWIQPQIGEDKRRSVRPSAFICADLRLDNFESRQVRSRQIHFGLPGLYGGLSAAFQELQQVGHVLRFDVLLDAFGHE